MSNFFEAICLADMEIIRHPFLGKVREKKKNYVRFDNKRKHQENC